MNLDLCDQGAVGDKYPGKPCVEDNRFLSKVREHYGKMSQAKDTPDWIKTNYRWQENANRAVQCGILSSLVAEVSSKIPGKGYGHVLEIPGFGKILLAELLVDCNSYHLTMLRLELGCPTDGSVSACAVKANGRSFP